MSQTLTTINPSSTRISHAILPSPRLAIVDLTPNNIGTLRKLNSVLFPVSYSDKFYHQVLEHYLSDFCKLIYYNDLPVGAVCCRIEPDPKQSSASTHPNHPDQSSNQTKLYIMTLGVLAPYRQQGLATKLLDQVISAAQKINLKIQSTCTSNAEGGLSTSNNPTKAINSTNPPNPSVTESKKSHQKGKRSTPTNKSSHETNSEQAQPSTINPKSTPQEPTESSSSAPIKIPSISTAYVHVQAGNEDAKQFYINRGFQVDGQISEYYRKIEPRAAWILVKQLST